MNALHEQMQAAAASGITFHRAQTHADDIHGLADALGLGTFGLVGGDVGSQVLQVYSRRPGVHPFRRWTPRLAGRTLDRITPEQRRPQ